MTGKRNPELERALVARPDDLASKLVYADWLQTRGDPWGELIVRQQGVDEAQPLFQWDDPAGWKHAVRQHPIDNALYAQHSGDLEGPDPARESDELADALRAELLEVDDPAVRLRWRHGFVDGVFFPQSVSHDVELDQAVDRLLTHRGSLLLRELALGAINWHTGAHWNGRVLHYQPEIEVIAAHAPPCLERLVLGAWSEHDISWTGVGDVSALYEALPRLSALELQGQDADLGEVKLPRLRRFVFRSGGLPAETLAALHRADWPALEQLELWFGDEDYGGSPSVEVAEPFLRAERLPALRELHLRNAMFTDELCQRLPAASILPRLTRLDLSMGTLSDEGARALLARPEAFAHLERLDLRASYLSPPICARLSGLCADVDTRFQNEPRRTGRYVSVGE